MPALLSNIDPDGLLEFSVVYTDRALNHMSQRFQGVMRDISQILKQVYKSHATVLVPGSGTFGMEAVARQFANNQKCLVLRNGWFSYRWTQIFEMGHISDQLHVIQKMTMKDANHFDYEMTIDDPLYYTKPWTNTRVYTRMKPGDELIEYSCEENNKDLTDGHIK